MNINNAPNREDDSIKIQERCPNFVMQDMRISNFDANTLEKLVNSGIVRSRRLDRPVNVNKSNVYSLISGRHQVQHNGNFATMIPIAPGDAKHLGLKIPGSDSATRNSATSVLRMTQRLLLR